MISAMECVKEIDDVHAEMDVSIAKLRAALKKVDRPLTATEETMASLIIWSLGEATVAASNATFELQRALMNAEKLETT